MAIFLSFPFVSISWSSDQRVDEAFSQFVSGNVEKAEKLLNQELAKNPQDGLAHLLLAFCFLKQGNEKKRMLNLTGRLPSEKTIRACIILWADTMRRQGNMKKQQMPTR